jgi:tetratricopeptide (TPR) repeat protein
VSSWSNRFVSVSALTLLAACQSSQLASRPPAKDQRASAAESGTAAGVAAPDTAPIPDRAAQQYALALELMKSGRDTDAELEFQQLIAGYPQLMGPQLNLGLLYLRDSRLPEAETAFKTALEHSPNNVVAGNELGIVERKLGKFTEAEAAYQRTIAVDPNYAPAHLNLGVLYDLYLAQPQKALGEFERYVEIAGENKQVTGWLAELRKRTGTPARVPASTSAPAPAPDTASPPMAAPAPGTASPPVTAPTPDTASPPVTAPGTAPTPTQKEAV